MNQRIEEELEKIRVEAFNQGIEQGYAAAYRIYVRYNENRMLMDPHSPEKLEDWARNDLENLRGLKLR